MTSRKNKSVSIYPIRFFGSNFKKFLNRIVTTSAIPMGIPGCPELAFCTASIDKNLNALARSLFVTFKSYPV